MNLITVDEARAHLRIEDDVLTDALTLAVAAANGAVWTYLKRREPYESKDDIPPAVKLAALMMAGVFIRDPDGAESEKWEQGYLPFPVINLCYPHRDPSMS
jgi:hypothetical protein